MAKKTAGKREKYRASGQREDGRNPIEVRDEQARAGTQDEEASKRLQGALARFGVRLGGNMEANYRDLRDCWVECLTEAWEKVTGKSARWRSKQEVFNELVKIIRASKLVVFPEVDLEARTAPQAAVNEKAKKVVTVNPQPEEDTTMATEKAAPKKAAPKKAAPKKAAPKKAAPKKAAAKTGDKKESAAAMFRRLIGDGKLTDDQIFAQVQKAHGLDDKKRSYVAWYRNSMAKAKASKKVK